MKNNCLSARILRICHNLLHSKPYLLRSKINPNDFTRNRKLGFVDFVLFLLSGMKDSLQAELFQYLDMSKQSEKTYSKQAFSKGRLRIRPEAFKELSDTVVKNVYPLAQTRTWNGYHLLAIDGSFLNLPFHPETVKEFGAHNTSGAPQPQALCSCLYDILNGLIVDAKIGPRTTSERAHAEELIRGLDTNLINNPLYLMDRGYPSSDMLALMEELGQKYLMRCEKSFLCAVEREGNDVVVTHKFKNAKEPIKFRVITVKLEGGEGKPDQEEYLITNLFDERFGEKDFAELYHLRWGIETKYDDLKNKLRIENFTGNTPIAIRQDFFATLYLANLAGVFALDYRDEIEAAHNTPENKHTYKMNVNLTIAALKQDVISLLLYDSPTKRVRLLSKIERRLQNAVVPIRPDRSPPREKRHRSSKFPSNKKLP